MKKIGVFFVVLLLAVFLVLGQRTNMNNPENTNENTKINELDQEKGQGQIKEQENIQQQTQNQGENSQIQAQVRNENNDLNGEEIGEQVRARTEEKIKTGNYKTESGKEIQIQEQNNNRVQLRVGNSVTESSLEMVQEETETGLKLKAKLSNGKNVEIKVMPDTASEKALERLRLNVCSEENNCKIELKETGTGEQVKAMYEIKAEKQAKLFGLFKTKMQVKAQVNAENGDVVVNKPWWAFLAKEE